MYKYGFPTPHSRAGSSEAPPNPIETTGMSTAGEAPKTSNLDEVSMDNTFIPREKNTLIFTNKQYHMAILTMPWEKPSLPIGLRNIMTIESFIGAHQMFYVRPHPSIQHYVYLENLEFPEFRLRQKGTGKFDLEMSNSNYDDDQLWAFSSSGNEEYTIRNKKYQYTIRKFASDDMELGVTTGSLYPDMQWTYEPRFVATFSSRVIFEVDNRQGTQPIKKTESVTRGLSKTNTTAFRQRKEFKSSMEIGLEVGIKNFGISPSIGMELTRELELCLTSESEENWSHTSAIEFIAPGGKYYRVIQYMSGFSSRLASDNTLLRTKYEIYEDVVPPSDAYEGTEKSRKIIKEMEEAIANADG